jgi:hypothetical protein
VRAYRAGAPTPGYPHAVKLWLDDIRPCPDGYTHARSVNEAIKLLERGDCAYASLDHDLGDFAEDGGDGFKLVLWIAEHDRWPSDGIRVHSANPPGMARMLADIDHYGPYPPGNGISRGVWPDPG